MHDRRLAPIVEDDFSDIECHVDEWKLPPCVDGVDISPPARHANPENPYDCNLPSPLIHEIREEREPPSALPRDCGAALPPKRRYSDFSPSPIPKRIYHPERDEAVSTGRLKTKNLKGFAEHIGPISTSTSSFGVAINHELRARADNDCRLNQLGKDDAAIAIAKNREAFRWLEWAKKMVKQYPEAYGELCSQRSC